ncbi:uncharacterized protein KY384_002925 [Bacidia gigantensis]|uniref:uncharacterized protein n=1 Tax=Bacidia gigantensis TaxID=2732470 RepID=UPI001D042127|nr:uncharacterized protein KY384_002925 [Bacidia gigantensis]KAG8531297.1 hypothetical protein KY384_002925 [Bacidia gigantensis]
MAAKLLPYSLMTIATLSGFKYTTHYQHPKSSELPYILFTHGFPSSAYDWRHQVEYFSNEGYGIIAPDTLGYGSTDQPMDVHAYTLRSIADSLIEVVDKVAGNETRVVGVAHDWSAIYSPLILHAAFSLHDTAISEPYHTDLQNRGSGIQSRLANFHPDRFSAYVFLTPYTLPGFFNVTEVNIATKAALGYSTLGYWEFFNKTEAGPIIGSHKTPFADLLYPDTMDEWKTNLGPVDSTEAFLTSGKDIPHAPYVTDEEQKIHNSIFARNGYTPALGYYRASMAGYNTADGESIDPKNLNTTTPTLFVGATKDPLLILDQGVKTMQAFNPKTVVTNVEAGHWSQLEAKDQVNKVILSFLQGLAIIHLLDICHVPHPTSLQGANCILYHRFQKTSTDYISNILLQIFYQNNSP